MNKQYVSFRVEGEFITRAAREKCHCDGEYEKAVALLMDCMQTNSLTKREIRHIAIDILDGYAELRGTYPNDDYGPVYLNERDTRWSIDETMKKLSKKKEEAEHDFKDLSEKYCFVCENLSDWKLRELDSGFQGMTGKPLFKDSLYNYPAPLTPSENFLLDSYMKRQKMDTEDDYGWLEPDGTFHPVEWGEHQKWADEWLREHLSEKEYESFYLYEAGDNLTERYGWVLLHNPAQGIALITRNEYKPLTKAQKDFLYGYYIDRGCEKEANAIMMDGNEMER